MTAQRFLETQCHEFDAFFNSAEYGLKPYYGLTNFRKEHDWVNDGKSSVTFEFEGQKWAAVLDYDDQSILPCSDPTYKLETAYPYRIYLVCMDETYDDESPNCGYRAVLSSLWGFVLISPTASEPLSRILLDVDGLDQTNKHAQV